MRRLVIAIDCDDVLLPSTPELIRMYNAQYGTHVSLEGAHTADNPAWEADARDARRRIFDLQHSTQYGEIVPYNDAIAACSRLAQAHELHLVTARPDELTRVTERMLKQYFGDVFSSIEHVGLDASKGEVCRRIAADVLIDDNLKHLEDAQNCSVPYTLWFGDYPWNQQVHDRTGIHRCGDWSAVEQEIDRIASA